VTAGAWVDWLDELGIGLLVAGVVVLVGSGLGLWLAMRAGPSAQVGSPGPVS
jgi:hypothetical protein